MEDAGKMQREEGEARYGSSQVVRSKTKRLEGGRSSHGLAQGACEWDGEFLVSRTRRALIAAGQGFGSLVSFCVKLVIKYLTSLMRRRLQLRGSVWTWNSLPGLYRLHCCSFILHTHNRTAFGKQYQFDACRRLLYVLNSNLSPSCY